MRADEDPKCAVEQQRDPAPFLVALIQAIGIGSERRRREEKREQNETMVAVWTKVIGIFSIVAAMVAVAVAYVFYSQLRVMHGQLEEMQAEQRSWVSLQNAQITSPMSRDNNGLRITLQFDIRNSGKNPAANVMVVTDASVMAPPNPTWEQRICSKAPSKLAGIALFPGDVQSFKEVVYVKNSDLDRWLMAFEKMKIANVLINPAVVACVQYRDIVTGEWHYTPYGLELQTKSGEAIPLSAETPPQSLSVLLQPITGVLPD